MKQKNITRSLSLAALLFSLVGCNSTTSSTTNGTTNNTGSSTTAATTTFDTTKTIKCYTRDTTSGTRDGFFTTIGMKEQKENNSGLVSGFVEVTSNGNMINSVKSDTYGIGYISLASLETSGLKGLTYENVKPTEENVLNKTYGLTRNFNYIKRADYASDSKVGQIVDAFIAYMNTKEGKAIIKSNDGILSITTSDKSWDDIKANYSICTEDNSNITVKFGGSTSVEKIAKALTSAFSKLCGNFIASHNHAGSGDAYKYTQASATKDSASAMDIGFLSRELSSTETAAENTSGKICTDAIVAVVNTANTLTSTTAATLKSIYTGEKTVWNQVIVA